jgi:hypothetical protein
MIRSFMQYLFGPQSATQTQQLAHADSINICQYIDAAFGTAEEERLVVL